MFGIGASELLIIFLFALLFIGPKKLPELAKGLGKGIREFQKAKDDLMDHVNTPAPTDHTAETEEPAKEASLLTEVKAGNFVEDEVIPAKDVNDGPVKDVVDVLKEANEDTAQEVTAASKNKEEAPKSDS